MNLTDLFIGGLLMNAMPHLIFGLTKTRYLSLFGYSAAGNIGYAALQLVIAMVLFHIEHSISTLFNNGLVLGATGILFIFFLFGKFTVKFYSGKKREQGGE